MTGLGVPLESGGKNHPKGGMAENDAIFPFSTATRDTAKPKTDQLLKLKLKINRIKNINN